MAKKRLIVDVTTEEHRKVKTILSKRGQSISQWLRKQIEKLINSERV